MNEIKPYPPEILKINTTEGFMEEFYTKCATNKNVIDAFDEVNELHCKYFGRTKYNDYDSFKQVRNRLIRQMRNR